MKVPIRSTLKPYNNNKNSDKIDDNDHSVGQNLKTKTIKK